MDGPNNTPTKTHGAWLGIDLGTTNCTAAIWDLNQSRPKVLRLGHGNLARPVSSGKGGKIVPSAVAFYDGGDCIAGSDGVSFGENGASLGGMSTLVGYRALQAGSNEFNDRNKAVDGATITSFKRVVGMTVRQAKELQVSDPGFWNSLPFQSVIVEDGLDEQTHEGAHNDVKKDQRSNSHQVFDVLGEYEIKTQSSLSSTSTSSATRNNIQEGVAIRVQPLSYNPLARNVEQLSTLHQNTSSPEHLITPLDLTTILLHSIRNAANSHLVKNKSKIRPPGMARLPPDDTSRQECTVENCIIGVPAHYSHNQRSAIQTAAKLAGFHGYVGVMTESTAAAMAYGLFVSPNIGSSEEEEEEEEKRILVFDMGGGTTDVTIAIMDADSSSKTDGLVNHDDDGDVRFRVVATAGNRCLGGDDVDELVARHLWKKMNQTLATNAGGSNGHEWEASKNREFIRKCRTAKEQLCGNDDEDEVGLHETHFTFGGVRIDVTRKEFDQAIQPLVVRAETVIDDALAQIQSSDYDTPIHEVVLVGGSSHIPTIRDMLRRKFPPPIPPELCTSISAETAVAQGLAIQSALISGEVPLWELRNAMMLDALPHSIGVWVDSRNPSDGNGAPVAKGDILHAVESGGNVKGHYVEILQKDSPLPAKGSATFTLANMDQFGVTIVAVEQIGVNTFQCMGVFTFLLHRLDIQKLAQVSPARQVEVGMVLETNGQFMVSIFDENDPEHRNRKRQFLRQKGIADDEQEYLKDEVGYSGTESSLFILFAIVFCSLCCNADCFQ
eukprot:CCRYP_013574-RA/>CCRYP_013574-RA protein AED:0.34 eAED:0.34 QI:0/-1/0/1/-1/1/1/0/779